MATLTSHTLNAVDGTHAGGIAVSLYRILPSEKRLEVFTTVTDEGGRLAESVDTAIAGPDAVFELVFGTGAYFEQTPTLPAGLKPVREVVIRLEMPDPDARYHIPVILSPNGYSVWWSG